MLTCNVKMLKRCVLEDPYLDIMKVIEMTCDKHRRSWVAFPCRRKIALRRMGTDGRGRRGLQEPAKGAARGVEHPWCRSMKPCATLPQGSSQVIAVGGDSHK